MHQLGQDPNGRIPVGLIETVYGKYRADQMVQQGQATLEGAGASPQQPPSRTRSTSIFPAQNAAADQRLRHPSIDQSFPPHQS
jgi:hypothetical protein